MLKMIPAEVTEGAKVRSKVFGHSGVIISDSPEITARVMCVSLIWNGYSYPSKEFLSLLELDE